MKRATNIITAIFTTLLIGLSSLSAVALKSDQDQPATLDADQFDMDFQTGVRTYRGNVVYQQGTIRLKADEIVAYFKDNQLERAIARGNPARFKQRPDGKDEDVVGTALRIELDEIKNLVTMENDAVVTQGSNTITGRKITYDLETERVKVRSGGRQQTETASPEQSESDQEAGADGTDPSVGGGKGKIIPPKKSSAKGSSRPRLIIKPRKK